MAAPLVSVIIPAYNSAAYIREALDSVFAQTYAAYEIIVVNDGSLDTPALEAVLAPYRDRIVYLSQENLGPSAARNAALRVARGRYAAILDSDDRFDPEYLASQVALLEGDATIDVAYPEGISFGEYETGRRYSDLTPENTAITFSTVLSRECQIYGEVTARVDMLQRAGLYDVNLRAAEDYDLWLRILSVGGRIAFNPSAIAFRRTRRDSISGNPKVLLRSVLQVLEKVEGMELCVADRTCMLAQRAAARAELSLLEGKEALAAGNVAEALLRFREIDPAYRNWKTRVVMALLQVAPRLVAAVFRVLRPSSRAALPREGSGGKTADASAQVGS